MKLPGLPRTSKVIGKDAKLDEDWDQYLQKWLSALNNTTQQFSSASDTSVSTSVVSTAFPASPNLPSGLYQVTYAMWVTQAASSSSSLTFTASWENNGETFSQSGVALASNTLTSQQNDTFTFNIDSGTAVTYSIAYASVGGTPMTFSYDARLSALPTGEN